MLHFWIQKWFIPTLWENLNQFLGDGGPRTWEYGFKICQNTPQKTYILQIFLGEDRQTPTFKCSNNPLLPVAFKTTNVYSYENTNHMLYCFFLAQVFWNSCLNIHKKYWYNLLLDKSFWKALCSQKTIFGGPPIW